MIEENACNPLQQHQAHSSRIWFVNKQGKSRDQTEKVADFSEIVLTFGAIQRPRTRSVAARQVSNAHERDLVTNQNV
jgi:hypothetical protein